MGKRRGLKIKDEASKKVLWEPNSSLSFLLPPQTPILCPSQNSTSPHLTPRLLTQVALPHALPHQDQPCIIFSLPIIITNQPTHQSPTPIQNVATNLLSHCVKDNAI